MKVIAFNGSPHKNGNTYLLIRHALDALENEGIWTEIVQIGGKKVHPCIACGKCFDNQDKRCIQGKDMINECIEKMEQADGVIIGTPTYFSGVTPEIKAFMDRVFYVGLANNSMFRRKLGAAVVAVRRAGAVSAMDSINHYFGISGMFTAGSRYWNLGIGLEPGDVESDREGIDTMKQLGENMAWFIKTMKQ